MQAGAGQAVNVEAALQAMNITKQFSRDLLSRSLPVPDATLAAHQKALAALAAKARQARLQARAPRTGSPPGARPAVRGRRGALPVVLVALGAAPAGVGRRRLLGAGAGAVAVPRRRGAGMQRPAMRLGSAACHAQRPLPAHNQ